MEINEMPGWLQTLRNINPSLAEKAESDVLRWKVLEQFISKLTLANVSGFISTPQFDTWVHENKITIDVGTYLYKNKWYSRKQLKEVYTRYIIMKYYR